MPASARALSIPRRRRKFDVTKMYALTGFSSANAFGTQAGGGEVGDGTTGFGLVCLFQVASLSGQQFMLHNLPTGAPWAGYQILSGAANMLSANASSTTAALVTVPGRQLASSDVGRLMVYGLAYDPVAGRLRGYADRQEIPGAPAMTTYVAGTLASRWGVRSDGTSPSTGLRYLGWVAWRGVLSNPNLLALFDAIRTGGDMPTSITGVTITRRWSLRDVIITGKYGLESRQVAPAVIPDSVSGASIDAMTRVGAPTVSVIDPSIDGRVTHVPMGFTSTSYLKTMGAATGLAGAATGHWYAHAFRVMTAVGGTSELIASHTVAGADGWALSIVSTGIRVLVPGVVNSPIASPFTAADVGQLMLAVYTFDGATHKVWMRRALVSSVAGGYSPPISGETSIGARGNDGYQPAISTDWRGSACGVTPGGLTDAEATALFDAFDRTGRISAVVGKTQHLWDPTLDVIANGGPSNGVPATILDRAGTDHLTRVGTGLVVSPRTERLWSYETTPVLRGAEGLTLTDYFETAVNALPGDPAGFMVSILCNFQTLITRTVFAQRGASNPGWGFSTSASQMVFSCGGSATAQSPGAVVTADVGKLSLFTGVWDQAAGMVRIYAKRVQVGTGAALSGAYAPASSVAAMIGRSGAGTNPSTGVAVYGVFYATGIPTLAQVQAQFDAVQATDRIQAVPGFTGTLIDLSQDIPAGTVPATLVDRGTGGVSFTKVGSPVASPQYSRALAW